MYVESVHIKNFRLFKDVVMSFERATTVIVGRNNSGKTSLTEVFDRLVGDKAIDFTLEDFSASACDGFIAAKALKDRGASAEEILAALPKITVRITIRYDDTEAEFGPLSPFIIDLDETCTQAIVHMEYRASLATIDALFDVPPAVKDEDANHRLFAGLRTSLPRAYSAQLTAIDPTDADNQRSLEKHFLTELIGTGFVRAQRSLDKTTAGGPNVLGRLLEDVFKTASSKTAATGDQSIVTELKAAVEAIENQIRSDFDLKLKDLLLPAFNIFGYPGLSDPQIMPQTTLNVESLLSNHTKVFYSGSHGVHLPEHYNGLGTRNLIYILLQLITFHKEFRSEATLPGVHLVFIEEPEAHLHPQMQEVFIQQLNEVVAELSKAFAGQPIWPVQFVVSTHSSHLANAADFDAIRYFLTRPSSSGVYRQTAVKDFRIGLDAVDPVDRDFLHKYMTLTKCDLYFADKAILVEGSTERLLMPRMRQLIDAALPDEQKLARQYLTIVEAGGAHAHIFYPLLDFLELRTLVIADLDCVRKNENSRWIKCPYAEAKTTSNAALKKWFLPREDKSKAKISEEEKRAITEEDTHLDLAFLASKTADEKIIGLRRIAYQIPEVGSEFCARSFEDALVLANPVYFGLKEGDDWEQASWDIADGMNKTSTALNFGISVETWVVPLYMKESLEWLAGPITTAETSVVGKVDGAAAGSYQCLNN